MFHGVQAGNQIFLGEFQLSDKVGCILAYPGSYPHTTLQYPSTSVAGIAPAAIPLPLGEVNPSVAAWIICTPPIRIPIFLTRGTLSRKRALQISQTWCHINNQISLWWKHQDQDLSSSLYEWLQKTLVANFASWKMQKIYLHPSALCNKNILENHSDDDDDAMITPGSWSVVSACGKTAVREISLGGAEPSNILRYTQLIPRYIRAFKDKFRSFLSLGKG